MGVVNDMRCIDADALLTDLNNIKYPGAPYVDAGIRIAVGKICDAQTIEPERKKGRWTIKNGELAIWDVCSECKKMVMHRAPFYNYCPNCGADMRGDKHEID